MIKAVVFDFGGVVITEGFDIWRREYIPDESVIAEECAIVGPQVDRGTLLASGYTDIFARVTNKTSQEVNDEIIALYELKKETVALIKKLKEQGIKIGLIANFPTDWFDYLFEKFSLSDLFDSVNVSSKLKIIKPEARIYQHALEELRSTPEEAVFIDDKRENVEGAIDIGMHGIVYIDTQSLTNNLKQLGLVI